MFVPVLQWFILLVGRVNECKCLELLCRSLWSSYLCNSFRLRPRIMFLKEEYQRPVVELMRVLVPSVLVQFSVPSEEKVEVEGYEFDDDF